MPQVQLSTLQALVADAIRANPWFSGVTVIADLGRQSDFESFESALTSGGLCVVVHAVNGCQLIQHGRGVALVRALFRVEVVENAEQNSVGLAKDLLTAASLVASIVLSINTGLGELTPAPDINLMDLVGDDSGLRAYILNLHKIVQIS